MSNNVSLKTKKQINAVKRNSWIFIATRLDLTSMIVPVIVKIWESANMDFSQMLFLQGIFSLVIVLAEIPSGAISDTFQRKYVIAFGYSMLAFATIIYSIATSFGIFAIGETLFGIGLATISGSDTGLLYDTLTNNNQEERYKEILGKSATITFIVAMGSLLISGAIALRSLRWPLYILSATFIVKATLSMFMIEVERVKAVSIQKATKAAVKKLFTTKLLLGVLLAVLAASVAQRVAFWSYQPKLFQNNLTTLHVGIIFAGMNLVAAIGSTVFAKIKEKHEDFLLLGLMLIEIVNIVILWRFNSLIILTTMMIVQLSRGGRAPVVGTMIQRKASSDLRATLVSVYSSIGNLIYFIVSLIFTIYSLSIANSLLSMLVFSIVIVVFFAVLVWTNHNGNGTKKEANELSLKNK